MPLHLRSGIAPAFARIFPALALLSCAGAPASAAVDWWKNISDTYQHQRWGAPATTGRPPGPGQPDTRGADPDGDPAWQAKYNATTDTATFGGWCFPASVTNQLYYMKQRGYAATTGAVNNAKDLHNELNSFQAAWFAAPGNLTESINQVFEARGVSPTKTRDGLTAQNYRQDGDEVVYQSTDGTGTKKLGKGKLFDHLATVKKFGDAANLRLSYNGPRGASDPQKALWWAGADFAGGNFHSVSVAGFDTAGDGTIYFADPDSNPTGAAADALGNRNQDSGWSKNNTSWRAAPAGVPEKQRRFTEGATPAGVPVPGATPPSANDQGRLYFTGTLAADKTKFSIAGADYKRYDNVQIRLLETLEVVKAGNKPRNDFAPTASTFEVSPGQTASGPDAITGNINQCFVFASSLDEQILGVSNFKINDMTTTGWVASLLPLNFVDPWNNDRPFGGVVFTALDPNAPLVGRDLLSFNYLTANGGDLTKWDFVYNDIRDTTLASLGVQTRGGGFDLPFIQIPAPSALTLIGLASLAAGRRRRPA